METRSSSKRKDRGSAAGDKATDNQGKPPTQQPSAKRARATRTSQPAVPKSSSHTSSRKGKQTTGTAEIRNRNTPDTVAPAAASDQAQQAEETKQKQSEQAAQEAAQQAAPAAAADLGDMDRSARRGSKGDAGGSGGAEDDRVRVPSAALCAHLSLLGHSRSGWLSSVLNSMRLAPFSFYRTLATFLGAIWELQLAGTRTANSSSCQQQWLSLPMRSSMGCVVLLTATCVCLFCSALQGLLRKLGANFEDMLPMGVSGARMKVQYLKGDLAEQSWAAQYLFNTLLSSISWWMLACNGMARRQS
jgi:hypothetical protein